MVRCTKRSTRVVSYKHVPFKRWVLKLIQSSKPFWPRRSDERYPVHSIETDQEPSCYRKKPVFLASCFFLTELLSLARDTKLNFKILVLKQNLVEVSSTSNVSTQVLC